ncbi:Kinase, NEK [Giardia muris]|uniref:Kinase, NEK n=1 Tax=Giardia muris TaxID=5742 RepID=A0A4Z1SQV4_GIAMU|nr:Kinase, NEK [Giardia muris]|eukprot:TNJ28252.1 Kinase, NEK [Giardia muris]
MSPTALMKAAERGEIEAVKANLEDLGEKDGNGETALMQAAKKGHSDCIPLLEREIGIQDKKGQTALMLAAWNGHTACIPLLKDEIGKKDKDGETALMKAIRRGHANCVAHLEGEIGIRGKYGRTTLMLAAEYGHANCIPLLNRELGKQSRNGETALMRVAIKGHTSCVQPLLSEARKQLMEERKFTLNGNTFTFPPGTTALMLAAHYNRPEVVELLLPYEQGLKDSEGHTAKWHANSSSWRGDFTRVRQLLEDEGTERIPPPKEQPPLMVSAVTGDIEGIKQHLDHVGYRDSNGTTALMMAAGYGHSDCIPFLEREIGMRNNYGTTALMWAAITGHANCIPLLEKELGMQDKKGCTALMFAARNGKTDCVRPLLSEAGEQAKKKWTGPIPGTTALMIAAHENYPEIVELLLPYEQGLKDSEGHTAEWYANNSPREGDFTRVRRLLENEGSERIPPPSSGLTSQEHINKLTAENESLKKELSQPEEKTSSLENPPTRTEETLISSAIQGDLNTLRRHLDQAGQKDSSGMTALMHAASRGQTEVVRLLRPLEARLQDGRGWTALMHAVGGGHEECVGLLLLEQDIVNGEYEFPEDIATKSYEEADGERKVVYKKIVSLLEKKSQLPRLPKNLSEYHLTAVLGKGTFGVVYAGHGNDRNVAVKVVSLGGCSDKERELLRREAEILPSLDHPNIIRCLGTGENDIDDTYVIVTDLCCGDLRGEMNRRKKANSSYSDQEVWRVIREVADALTYLHEKRHVHRDLKPANILLSSDGRCVLGGFEVARTLGDSSRMKTTAGTPLYMAPEIHREEDYDKSVDVWALGVVAHELCTGELPFSTVPAILERGPPAIENRDGGLVDLIFRMLSKNPERRPTAREVLEEAEREDDTTPDTRAFPSLPESMKQHYSLKTSFKGRPNTFKAVDNKNKPCMIEVVPHPEGPSLLNSPTELKDLRHQNVLEYSCVTDDGKGRVFIVTAWHPSTLQDAMAQRLENEEIEQHLRQLALGLEYLHGKGIVLRSICPKSVLLSDDGECILGGLDCASFISDAPCKPMGEPLRRPPEMQQGRTTYRPSADIWALGLLAYELCTGRLPFTTEEQVARMDAPPPEERDQDLVTLVLRMLEKNPERRPTAQEVVRTLRRR